jgi:RNA polymerase sigma-70 factor (ECF subfamily)
MTATMPSLSPVETDRSVVDLAEGTAFDRLYSAHKGLVEHVVRRYLWGAVVEDVVQETFAQAYRSGLHLLDTDYDHPVERRLTGIARNRSIDVLRRRMRGRDEVTDDGRLAAMPSVSWEADPERRFQTLRRRAGIAEAFDGMAERQRRVLFMKYVDGLSYEEIAEAEGMTPDGVKATLARGRRSFRELYASIAERSGLSVVLGGGLVGRLRARLRWMREQASFGATNSVAGIGAATPAMVNAVVAAVVVGSLAVVGTATFGPHAVAAPAPVAFQDRPESAEHPSNEDASAPAEDDTGQPGEERSDGVAVATPESAPQAPDAPAARPRAEAVGAIVPDRSASAETSVEQSVGDESAPADAHAGAGASADADTGAGQAQTEGGGDAGAATGVSHAAGGAFGDAGVGCPQDGDYRDEATAAACPVVDEQLAAVDSL